MAEVNGLELSLTHKDVEDAATDIKTHADRIKTTFDNLLEVSKKHSQGGIKTEWMAQLAAELSQYGENEIQEAVEDFKADATSICQIAHDTIQYSNGGQ